MGQAMILQWLAHGQVPDVPLKRLDGLGSWGSLRVLEQQVLLPTSIEVFL